MIIYTKHLGQPNLGHMASGAAGGAVQKRRGHRTVFGRRPQSSRGEWVEGRINGRLEKSRSRSESYYAQQHAPEARRPATQGRGEKPRRLATKESTHAWDGGFDFKLQLRGFRGDVFKGKTRGFVAKTLQASHGGTLAGASFVP